MFGEKFFEAFLAEPEGELAGLGDKILFFFSPGWLLLLLSSLCLSLKAGL